MHETVAVPEPVMLPGVIEPQVRLEGRASVRLRTPVKPFTADSVIVEETVTPALTGAGAVAVIVKSWTLNSASVVWTSDPLVAVTVRV